MKIHDLKVGDLFHFDTDSNQTGPWEYRGNGWYGWPYSGGPYYSDGNPEVRDGQPESPWAMCDEPQQNLSCFV